MSSAKSVKSKKLKTGIELLKQFCNYLPRAKQPEWNCFFSTQHRICSGRFGVSLVLDSKNSRWKKSELGKFQIFSRNLSRSKKNKESKRKKEKVFGWLYKNVFKSVSDGSCDNDTQQMMIHSMTKCVSNRIRSGGVDLRECFPARLESLAAGGSSRERRFSIGRGCFLRRPKKCIFIRK